MYSSSTRRHDIPIIDSITPIDLDHYSIFRQAWKGILTLQAATVNTNDFELMGEAIFKPRRRGSGEWHNPLCIQDSFAP